MISIVLNLFRLVAFVLISYITTVSQASRTVPSDPYLLVLTPLCSLLPQWLGLTCVTNRILWKGRSVTSKDRL